MDVAASLLALVSFALNSIKTTHEIISTILDGPQIVVSAANSLCNAARILEELQRDRSQIPHDFSHALEGYRRILDAFQHKLSKLETSSTHGTFRRAWVRIKTVLQEKDIQRLHQNTMDFTSFVTNHRMLEQREIAVLSQDLIRKVEQQCSNHETELGNAVALTQSRFTSIDSALEAQMQASTSLGVTFLNELKASDASQNQIVLNLLQELKRKMQSVKTMSTEQSERMQKKLETLSLKTQATTTCDTGSMGCESMQTSLDMNTSQIEIDPPSEIEQAIQDLIAYSKRRDTALYCEEAEPIIEALDRILQYLFEATPNHDIGMKQEAVNDNADVLVRADPRESKRLRRLIGASQQVLLNSKEDHIVCRIPKGYHRALLCFERQYANGSIKMLALRGRIIENTDRGSEDSSSRKAIEILKGTLSILSNETNVGVSMSFFHRLFSKSAESIAPSITFSRILPLNSKVFRTIKNGDLDTLRSILRNKQAYLSDRDTQGCCLLNYALRSSHSSICRFLIDHGAVVDFIEEDASRCERTSLCINLGFPRCDSRDVANRTECQRLLLSNGADPLSEAPKIASLWEEVLQLGTTESLTSVYHEGREYIDIRYANEGKGISLYSLFITSGWQIGMVEFLLEEGAPVDYDDDRGGCLHHVIRSQADTRVKEETLILLLRYGANPHVEDMDNFTVSDKVCCELSNRSYNQDIAYREECHPVSSLTLRKIWISALTQAGYDAEEVINASVSDTICHLCMRVYELNGPRRTSLDSEPYWDRMFRPKLEELSDECWNLEVSMGITRCPKGRCIVFNDVHKWNVYYRKKVKSDVSTRVDSVEDSPDAESEELKTQKSIYGASPPENRDTTEEGDSDSKENESGAEYQQAVTADQTSWRTDVDMSALLAEDPWAQDWGPEQLQFNNIASRWDALEEESCVWGAERAYMWYHRLVNKIEPLDTTNMRRIPYTCTERHRPTPTPAWDEPVD